MNTKIIRDITNISGMRYVNGVPVTRDADFGILLEKRSFLDLVKKAYPNIESEFYSTWDREHLYYLLDSGAVVVITNVQGPAYAASGVERFLRTGVSHIIKIGTTGSLDENIVPGDITLAIGAIRDEGTTDKYLDKRVPAIADIDFTMQIFDALKQNTNFRTHMGVNITNGARFCENPDELHKMHLHAGAISIDMETSAILLVSRFHGISAASVGIVVDIVKNHDKSTHNLATNFVGRKNEKEYDRIIAQRILELIGSAFNVFKEISEKPGYVLARTYGK